MFTSLSDTEMIFLVLGVIYFSECVLWLPDSASAFCSTFRQTRSVWRPYVLGRDQGSYALLPLLPFTRLIVADESPIAVSPDGVAFLAGNAEGEFIAFDDLSEIQSDQRKLTLNKATVTLATAESSVHLSQTLRHLQSRPQDEREALIAAWLHQSCSLDNARLRLERVDTETSLLRTVSSLLWLWAFGYGPVLYYTVEANDTLLFRYLAVFACLWFPGVLLFWLAHRRLLRDSSHDRNNRLMTFLFSPASVMRVADSASRGAFAGLTPAALAAVSMKDSAFQEFVGGYVRSLCYTTGRSPNDSSIEFSQTRESFNHQKLDSVKALLSVKGINLDELLKPPRPHFDARSWCPRCVGQFTLSEGNCPECVDVSLIRFTASGR